MTAIAGEHWMDAAPLLRWLTDCEKREAMRMGLRGDVGEQVADSYLGGFTSRTLLADSIGLSTRRVWDYFRGGLGRSDLVQVEGPYGHPEWVERDVVQFSTVDRVVCRQGTWTISDIYPQEEIDVIDLSPSRKERFFCERCGNELLSRAKLCGFCIEEEGFARDSARLAA